MLRNSTSKAAKLLTKVLFAAVSNHVNGAAGRDSNYLFVDKVIVEKGRFFKRHHPVSHGKAEAILKRSCHIRVILRVGAGEANKRQKRGKPRLR